MSVVAVNRFRKAFPEFRETSDVLIEQKIIAAELRISTEVWGNRTEQGIMYLAADLIAMSPSGEKARLVSDKGKTTYRVTWEQMRVEVSMGVGRVS